ncbi:preprotein translocase subunit SecA [candidate division WWE3 bacterium CG10_big_fil_rev_8_21_14_0_10_32_10]|uniref:Protein translocase subunit SecA n=1 Tax=candidate division WWE3 bacterium CG10_big_fil_rev_8_21_14_0_10_32_10 TaxID=1975090 RepID=A0A2H0R9D8_UNCKA|nr:MAG: preprotein translocase subunit SecA [candidate division WWE3 bacterium CG10_big_fil_rev_8_21_14_0_10_32_10]
MLGSIKNIFDSNNKKLKKLQSIVDEINSHSKSVSNLSDKQISAKTEEYKKDLKNLSHEEQQDYLNKILPMAYALVKESSTRTVGMTPFDVQLMAGIALHQGKIAEQKTGEGKTLTATLPLYLNSLTGRGCHLVTPNDYLSRHGAGWYGPLYSFLGISVGVIVENSSFIYDATYTNENFEDAYSKHFKPSTRKQAYECDVTYGTNNEFGFDYLRDNMENDIKDMVQTNSISTHNSHNFAIVDEVDSILIDEARTPLIISSSVSDKLGDYMQYANIAKKLDSNTDYTVDEKQKAASLTELGLRRVEKMLGIPNLYETDFEIVKQVENAVKAIAMYTKDKDYVVQNNQVKIVDEFTGRVLDRNRYSGGLHQAIEAKEGVEIQPESKTVATTSYQNYFRLYKKLAGMTGTAKTEEEEFYKIYGLDVIVLPTNKPIKRVDHSDVVYKTESAKYRAVAEDIKKRYDKGQPVLVGTTSVEKSELLGNFLKRLKIPHHILNAKRHEQEALIISQAGRLKSVTVATNMAGRGVDIILGGDPPNKKDQQKVKDLGGLYVIGTERHESRRIDNQLRGRSGRQGDPGESQFYISLQDDLMRVFGGAQVESLMNKLGVDENMPLSAGMVSKSIENSQKKVEGINFDYRKSLVQYDDVLNVQREKIYTLRRLIMQAPDFEKVHEYLDDSTPKYTVEAFNEWYLSKISKKASKKYIEYEGKYKNTWLHFVKVDTLNIINTLWMDHIDIMSDLRQGIGLRGHGQLDPLVEYKKEGRLLFDKLISSIWGTMSKRLELVNINEARSVKDTEPELSKLQYNDTTSQEYGVENEKLAAQQQGSALNQNNLPRDTKPYVASNNEKVGRNDPCPCGSGKKYKHCHGRLVS